MTVQSPGVKEDRSTRSICRGVELDWMLPAGGCSGWRMRLPGRNRSDRSAAYKMKMLATLTRPGDDDGNGCARSGNCRRTASQSKGQQASNLQLAGSFESTATRRAGRTAETLRLSPGHIPPGRYWPTQAGQENNGDYCSSWSLSFMR